MSQAPPPPVIVRGFTDLLPLVQEMKDLAFRIATITTKPEYAKSPEEAMRRYLPEAERHFRTAYQPV